MPLQRPSTARREPRLLLALLLLAACGDDGLADDVIAPPDQRVTVDVAGSPWLGPADAKVVIVEFADYQCPYCRTARGTLAELLAVYPDDVALVYKHYPLSFHANARVAAAAAAVAQGLGRFWELHTILYDHQSALERTFLDGYATSAGLDAATFAAALDGGEGEARVDADVAQADALGIPATPTFYVNGRLMVGAQPYSVFVAVVEEELRLAAP